VQQLEIKMCIHQNCSTKLKWDYLQGRPLGGHMCKEEEDKVKICCLKLVFAIYLND